MFANACAKAYKFTRPVIISTRSVSGDVNAACGTFFVVNEDGWVLTAGHLFDSFAKYQSDKNKINEVNAKNRQSSENPERSSFEIPKKIDLDGDWITNHSFWFGWDGVRVEKAHVNRQIDLALVKLAGFQSSWIESYPVFREPNSLRPGTSVCRLGFPFVNVATDFDEKNNAFRIREGVLPMPFFPNDGIHTRNILRGKTKDGYDQLYVETSTPGLRGQSGGPIFDTMGRIYAMQVQTNNIPLGFHPTAQFEGKAIVENQFLNVGIGVHGKVLQKFMKDNGVKFRTEEETDDGRTYTIN